MLVRLPLHAAGEEEEGEGGVSEKILLLDYEVGK